MRRRHGVGFRRRWRGGGRGSKADFGRLSVISSSSDYRPNCVHIETYQWTVVSALL